MKMGKSGKAGVRARVGKKERLQHNSQIQMLKNKKNNKDRNSKSRNKRILTVYSSQPSLFQPTPKGISLPLKKTTKHSICHLPNKPKDPKHPKPKHTLSTKQIKPTEIYERIPMHYMHSNTNSEIQFSNYGDTRNELQKPFRRPLFIDCDQQALMKEIWRVDKKKRGIEHDAATKIQKVFRGYLTRKLLMKYVLQYEEKLLAEKRLLERKVSFKSKREREESNYSSSLRNSYFPSNKKSIGRSEEWGSAEKENPLDVESSILAAEQDHFISLQEHQILSKPIIFERRGSEAERSSLTLNESSIEAQVQQISLSFGQDCQHSAHFIQPSKRREFVNESISSPNKSHDNIITQISNDKTRDAISQNISNCPSYSKVNKNERQNPSQFSSIMKEEISESAIEHEGLHLERLRSTEKAKWEQVISFVNQQMKEGINQEKTKELMSTILEFSVKNREELNSNHIKMEDQALVTPTTVTNRQEEPDHPFQSEQLLAFKKKKWQEEERDHDLQRVRKNQNMPLIRKMKDDKSIFERTSNLKQYFLKTMNFQDQQIDKMMELREAVLRRKESNSLIELNHLLENNLLSQDEFLRRLSQMTQTFERQKEDIEQTKNQIYQGYKAQLQLLKFTVLDAKFLGYKLPFCRSMQIFPNHPHWRFDELMIDELNQLACRRSQNRNQPEGRRLYQPRELTTQQIDNILESKVSEDQNHQKFVASESEEESISFSYEETNIYRKCEPFSFDISSLSDNNVANSPRSIRSTLPYNRFATLPINHGEDIEEEKKQNDFEVILQSEEEQNVQKSLKKETYEIEASQDEEEVLYKESDENLTQQIVDTYMNKLVWETVEDIYASNIIKSSFSIKNYKHCPLELITKKEKLDFIESVIQKLPSFDFFQERLNQKMYPNTMELLMSMREVSELQTGEPQYFEIGQYEYILNQEICYNVIEDFMEVYKRNRIQIIKKAKDNLCYDQSLLQQLEKYSSDKLKKTVSNANKIMSIKIEENEELRQQIIKIELHLILDSWNEELIKYRQNRNGYSGIGLNELSLSLIDRICRPMRSGIEFTTMMVETKKNLETNIVDDRLNEKLIKEYQQCVCSNDSQWILYSQEALEFGFDLAKTVEVELIFELLQDLHLLNEKRVKFIPEIEQYESQQSIKDSEEQSEQIYSSNGSLDGEDPLYLNEQQQMELQKKMSMLHNYNSDSQDSFYD